MSLNLEIPEIEVVAEHEFHYFDKPVFVIKAKNGHLYVALISICSIFGLNVNTEIARIQKHTVLKSVLAYSIINYNTIYCLRIGYMATWLLNLPLIKVSNPVYQKELEGFQKNASLVLEEAFGAGRLSDAPRLAELLEYDSQIGNAYREALAVLSLAREQLVLEGNSPTFRIQHSKKT